MAGKREVVINECYGGFSLSEEAVRRLAEMGCSEALSALQEYGDEFPAWGGHLLYSRRDDPQLVQVVKELGQKANGTVADLRIVQIPDDVEWTVEEYDGNEWIAEAHRTWR